ncbi:hypothetical protein SASPL_104804 [Salvia splendens]|uniref:Myb-like domain-containing protein n=1 Tax=Salvia splendens TaxID=180675 RepID=A0A8X9AA57_SALSN|nr:uncharacterized protein LOC121789384 [Salvia splendens]KAG6433196.1 hypothetical protein SASPL_104804 [Salvia splendens]
MSGSHRTRSKAAPDWTAEESLILVNEISAVESEWGSTLPSFQKWQQIVQNCNVLDVNRNLNQCKRHWDALLTAYRRVKQGAPPDRFFPPDLFAAVDQCLTNNVKRNDCAGEAEEEDCDGAAVPEEEEQVAMETDPDSDPEAQGQLTKLFFEIGSKKQRPRMKRQKRRLETQNPWGYFTSTKKPHEESSSMQEEAKNTDNAVESLHEEINTESKEQPESEEQTLATMLWERALQINAIVDGNLADDVDLKNAEAVQMDFTRRQGDKLIDCLGNISTTLNQLCDLVQKCN